MFYALLIICPFVAADPSANAPLAADCDLDHAIYAEQSPPIFETEHDCVAGALAHLHETVLPRIKEDTEYQIAIECEMTEEPA